MGVCEPTFVSKSFSGKEERTILRSCIWLLGGISRILKPIAVKPLAVSELGSCASSPTKCCLQQEHQNPLRTCCCVLEALPNCRKLQIVVHDSLLLSDLPMFFDHVRYSNPGNPLAHRPYITGLSGSKGLE